MSQSIPAVNLRLERIMASFVEQAIARQKNPVHGALSVVPLPEEVVELLNNCHRYNFPPLFLRLLEHFSTLLERSIPLHQFDNLLGAALAMDAIAPAQQVATAHTRARLLTQLGEHERARALLDAVRQRVRTRPGWEAEWWIRAGVLAVSQGRYDEGQRAYEAGLAIAQVNEDWANLSILYNNLGNLDFARDEYERATERYRAALAAAPPSEPIHGARAAGGMGMALDELGRFEEAGHFYEQARAYAQAAHDEYSLLSVDLNLSLHYILLEEYEKAKQQAGDVLLRARRLGDRSRVGFALHNMGWACLGNGEYEAAATHLCAAMELRLLLDEPLYIRFTLEYLDKLITALDADTLDHPRRDTLLQQCQQAAAAARGALAEG